MYFTYTGLLKRNCAGGFPQSADCSHVDFVREDGEDLWKTYMAAVLMDGIFLHLQ